MELDKLIIIIGPSAVGKTTIAKGLETSGLPVQKVITTTTRPKRVSETNGVDYHFLDDATFEKFIDEGGLVEWAKYNDHYYGSRVADIEPIVQENKIPLWVTESKGAEYFKSHFPGTFTIFILPENFDSIRRRLEKRNVPQQEIIDRTELAKQEILNAPKADAQVINYDGKIKQVIRETAEIIRKHFNL